jgi:AraC-like DNA-binding protein
MRKLASLLDISERHLSRGFRATYGTSPKQYARLARIEKVIAARKSGLGWTDVAYACGFTDQAHLIHDFGTIVGGTPVEFFGTAPRSNFHGADAAPGMSDSYNPFVVESVIRVGLASTAARRDASRPCIDRGFPLIYRFRSATAWP